MARLLGLEVEGFRALRSVAVGQVKEAVASRPLAPVSAFIGPNGTGKSTLLNSLGFLSDALGDGVEKAVDNGGGFARVVTQGESLICMTLMFDAGVETFPLRYVLLVHEDREGAPEVLFESLVQHQRREETSYVEVIQRRLLDVDEKSTLIRISGENVGEEKNSYQLTPGDARQLLVSQLGQEERWPQLVALKSYLQGWYLSYFQPEIARGLPPSGPQRRLDRTGSNLGNYLQYLARNHRGRLDEALRSISRKIPGLKSIHYRTTEDGRLLLQFNEQGFQDPFYQASMSDGTLKLLAYLLLLQDPDPPTLIGIEEPENGLYPRLQTVLAEELRAYAESGRTQVMLTTHSPYLVNALTPEQVFLMARGEDGGVQITRTADIPTIRGLYESGIPMGDLWYSNHFGEWKGE